MEVILLERIERLGQMGDIVSVKPGFARNYLLPQAKALRSSKENLAIFQERKVQLEAANLKRREEAEKIGERMAGLELIIVRQAAETGQLYGSVTGRDIRDAVRDAGITVERRQVVLDQPLKEIGSYDVRIILHPDVSRFVKITIARSLEEAERNAKAKAKAEAKAKAATEAEQTADVVEVVEVAVEETEA